MEKQLKSLNTRFILIDSELDVLDAQLNLAKDNLQKCFVRSMMAGQVLEKYVELGEVVSPAKAIVKLADLSELDLRVYVSGAQLPGVKRGQQVEVLIDRDRDNNQALTGEVTWISPEAEFTPKIIQTKEERVKLVYAIKVKVKNDGRLKIGMPGEVNF
jgi:HlyD family secretion protein